MKSKRKRLKKSTIISIITAAVCAVAVAALLIVNVYVPVKYLATYIICGSDNLDGASDVTFVDAGYGSCIIVRFPDGRVMLIDGGDGSYTNNCAVMSALNAMDIDYIDWLVCSSVKAEHCGGLSEVVKYKRTGTIFFPCCSNIYVTDEYYKFYTAAVNSGTEMVYSEYGAGSYGENYFFSFLSPSVTTNPDGEYAQLNGSATSDNINAASAVLWLEICGTSFIFCSDATESVMTKICENYLIVSASGGGFAPQGAYSVKLEELDFAEGANHGSVASAAFYDFARPVCTIISVGENTSGSPSTDALTTYCNYGEAYTTQNSGTIKINVYSDGYGISKEKQ